MAVKMDNESLLIGKYITLKNIDNDSTKTFKIESITNSINENEEKINQIQQHQDEDDQDDDDENTLLISNLSMNELPELVEESTNQWLFINDDYIHSQQRNKTKYINFCSAIFVVIIQMLSYLILSYYLISTVNAEEEERMDSCYGPNCYKQTKHCMHLTTGTVAAILFIGFLWADFINAVFMFIDAIKTKHWRYIIGSTIIVIEIC